LTAAVYYSSTAVTTCGGSLLSTVHVDSFTRSEELCQTALKRSGELHRLCRLIVNGHGQEQPKNASRADLTIYSNFPTERCGEFLTEAQAHSSAPVAPA
jgi:hypothetical protein